MNIRLSVKNDLNQLAAVELSAAKKFIEYLGDNAEQGQETLGAEILIKSHDTHNLWIAEAKNKVIGFLCALPIPNGLHIEEISVCSNHQGGGIGKDLIHTIIKEAITRGHAFISLTTDKEIPWNRPFYERLGFVICEETKCTGTLNDFLMKDKSHSKTPENRIAMVLDITENTDNII